MSPHRQLTTALVLSLTWAIAFVVGVDRDAFYPFLGAVAVVVVLVAVAVGGASGATSPRPAWWPPLLQLMLGLVVGAVTVAVTHVGYRAVDGALPGLVDDVARLQRLAGVTPSRLVLVVLIAVAEELLWRGLLLDALRQMGLRPLVAVSVSALVYAGSQLGPRSPWLCVAGLGFGALWGGLRLRFGMWAAIVAHLVWTLAILGALPLG